MTTATPQQRVREELASWGGKLFLVGAIVVVWLVDFALSHRLVDSGAVQGWGESVMRTFEDVSTVLFIAISLALIVAVFRDWRPLWVPLVTVYLAFSVLQVMVNVAGLIGAAHLQDDTALSGLWDVAAVYVMSVVVFMFVYATMDITMPRGAFVWPAREGEDPPTPNLVDYLFISLNTNATYGPTSEAVMSRRVKLIMALQVIMAVLMLTVLIARAVAVTT